MQNLKYWTAFKLHFPEVSQEFIIRAMNWVQTSKEMFKSRDCGTLNNHPQNTIGHFSDGKILEKFLTGAPSLTGQKLSTSDLQQKHSMKLDRRNSTFTAPERKKNSDNSSNSVFPHCLLTFLLASSRSISFASLYQQKIRMTLAVAA